MELEHMIWRCGNDEVRVGGVAEAERERDGRTDRGVEGCRRRAPRDVRPGPPRAFPHHPATLARPSSDEDDPAEDWNLHSHTQAPNSRPVKTRQFKTSCKDNSGYAPPLKQQTSKTRWYYLAAHRHTGWAKKRGHRLMTIIMSILNRFTNFYSERFLGKFAVKCILNIPPHLAYVATRPCETLMSAKQAINNKLQGSLAT